MTVGSLRIFVAGMALGAVLTGCRAVEMGPGYVPPPDGAGRRILSVHDERDSVWTIDAGVVAGHGSTQVDRMPSGLRVAVASDGGLPGTVATTAAEHGVAVPLPVGVVVWPAGAGVSRATDDAMWDGAEVRVDWMVTLSPWGRCGAQIVAVPRLTHTCGATALLDELTVRRSIELDQAIVLDVAPGHPSEAALALLVGGGPGRPARFVIRVRA